MNKDSITKGEFLRLRAIFDGAVERTPGEERRRFLEEACGDDAATLAGIERLLRQDAELTAGSASGALPRFGAYQAVRQLGRGGMGVVYEAVRDDGQYERRVAVKVLAASTLGAPLEDGIRSERQILAGFNHPGIAQLFDGGVTEDGNPYLVIEYVDGRHLDEYCAGLDHGSKLGIFLLVLDALEYAHARGVVHQDLKPSNVLVDAAGQPKVVDFGAASTNSGIGTAAEPPAATQARSITPEYAIPEALRGEPVDSRGDIYSLGVLYAKLFGNAANQAVVRRATASDPNQRYPNVPAFRAAILGHPRRRRQWMIAAAAMAAVALGALFWFAMAKRPPALQTAIRINPETTSWHGADVSADGQWVVFSSQDGTPGQSDIWVSPAAANAKGRAQRLFSDPAADADPTISPEGRYVAFRTTSEPAGIHEFDRQTGKRRPLVPGGHLPRYSPDGRWLLYTLADDRADSSRSKAGDWVVMPARGGPGRKVAAELLFFRRVLWDRDGQSILIQGGKTNRARGDQVWRWNVQSGDLTMAVEWSLGLGLACAVNSEGLLWVIGEGDDGPHLWRFPLSGKWEAGSPVVPLGQRADSCSSAAGATYFTQTGPAVRSMLLPLAADKVGAPRPVAVPAGTAGVARLISVSRDGKTRILGSRRSAVLDTGTARRVEVPTNSVVSGDGRFIWSTVWKGQEIRIFRRRTESPEGPPPTELALTASLWASAPDGSTALIHLHGVSPSEITLIDGNRSLVTAIAAHPEWSLYQGAYSPDGAWFLFTAVNKKRETRIYVAPLRGAQLTPVADWIEIGEGTGGKFSLDGNAIYYLSRRSGQQGDIFYRQSLDPTTKRPVGPPVALHRSDGPESSAQMVRATVDLHVVEEGLIFPVARPAGGFYRIIGQQ